MACGIREAHQMSALAPCSRAYARAHIVSMFYNYNVGEHCAPYVAQSLMCKARTSWSSKRCFIISNNNVVDTNHASLKIYTILLDKKFWKWMNKRHKLHDRQKIQSRLPCLASNARCTIVIKIFIIPNKMFYANFFCQH